MDVRQRGRRAAAALALAALALTARPALAQRPDLHWRTIDTPHFHVHFAPGVEATARHAAASAEWAYAALSRELVPPRGPIDLVVSDDADFSNGYTTTFPTNRIVVYTQPPVDDPELRDYDDWMTLVVTHELTHVFHLDRSRGLWRAAQYVFGRNPYLFPGNYEPRWVAEGLAVYYESRITGAGRIVGSYHRAVARAAASGGRSPRLGDLSVARSSFPGGEGVYIFGSLIFDELARSTGETSMRRFIESSSESILPFQLDRSARNAFGESFSAALRALNDSARRALGHGEPLGDWRRLTAGFDVLRAPRRDGDAILFGADPGKEMPGAYRVDTTGTVRRIGRRTEADVNVPFADGAVLTTQLEFTSPYEIRADLYVQRGRRLHRLTRGARLTAPDARADGEIVAVQAVTGTTVLARVSRDGQRITRITAATPDTQWAQPRWSPDGRRIVAVRLAAGGRSQIVVLDSTGTALAVLSDETGTVSASPAWSSDGRAVYFTSDRSGVAELYLTPAPGASDTIGVITRVSGATTALAEPLPLGSSGRATRLAVEQIEATGWVLGVGSAIPRDSQPGGAPSPADSSRPGRRPLPASIGTSAHSYSALQQLLPRYWLPIVYTVDDSTLAFGASTSGSDVIGRHRYSASAAVSSRWDERSGSLAYDWAGLGMPIVSLAIDQSWDGGGTIYDRTSGAFLGELRRRTRTMSAGLSASRPRTRYAVAAQAVGGIEWRDYVSHPDSLRAALSGTFYQRTHRRPFLLAALGASNTQSPRRSISAEDGVSSYVSAARLWDADESGGGHTRTVGSVAAYRSLDLPGYAHHVLALRVAGGWSDSEDPSEFTVGGTGNQLAALGISSSGSGTSDFPLRGYLAGALAGRSVLSGSVEYRAPLTIPARGFTVFFLDRSSLSLFSDAATAWCGGSATRPGCAGERSPAALVSVGGELVADLAIFYDFPVTLRLGAARAVGSGARSPAASNGAYLALGRSF